MADVFISYAREDHARVESLVEALAAQGLTVWWDRGLAPGDDYAEVIARELAAAKVVVVAWSAASAISPFVRDEASRGRDSGRLAPVLLEPIELPLGFGQIQTADLSGPAAARRDRATAQFAASVRARIDGGLALGSGARAGARPPAWRRWSVLVAAAAILAVGIAAAVAIRVGAPPPATQAQSAPQDSRERLLRLLEEGKISGAEAVELARVLQDQAFAPMAPEEAVATAGDAERDAYALAKAMFEDAAAQLVQDPDPRVREAVVRAAEPQSMANGMEALIALAEEGGASAGTIWRALGALASAHGDPRAQAALERARARNPQDRALWRLLAHAHAQDQQMAQAEGEGRVADGLEAAAQGREQEAAALFQQALPALEGRKRAFVLGLIGDSAAATGALDRAVRAYNEAVDLHIAERDVAALSVDAAKLARTQRQQGDTEGACRSLRRAAQAGATVSGDELGYACAEAPPAPPPLSTLIRPEAAP